jgi:arylsulfatase A-like enzyme
MDSTLRKYFLVQSTWHLVGFIFCTFLGLQASAQNLGPMFLSWASTANVFLNLWDLALLTLGFYFAWNVLLFCWLLPFADWFTGPRRWPRLLFFGGLCNLTCYGLFLALFVARAPAQARTSIAKGVIPLGEWAMEVLPGQVQVMFLEVATSALVCFASLNFFFFLFRRGRRVFKVLVSAVSLVGLFFLFGRMTVAKNQTGATPNVLVLAIDSLRPDRLSFAGYQRPTTPGLDKYLARSVYFENMHTSIARTTPSWTSMLTGVYPHTHGVQHMFTRPEERTQGLPTFIEVLEKRGYRTALAGDYAAETFASLDFGFDRLSVPRAFSLAQFLRQDFLQSHALLPSFLWGRLTDRLIPELGYGVFSADPQLVSRKLKGFIEEFNAEERPWLSIAFYSNLHYPYANTHPYYDLFSDPTYRGRSKYSYNIGNLPELLRLGRTPPTAEVAQVSALYDGALRRVDDEVARFLADLEHRGMLRNTVVVILSDHGEYLFDDGKIVTHGSWLEEHGHDTRMVFAVFDGDEKNSKLKGRRISEVTRSIDVASTLLDLLGFSERVGEGVPLLSGAKIPDLVALSETDIAFHSELEWRDTGSLVYPEIMLLLEATDDTEGTLRLQKHFAHVVRQAKWRIVRNNHGALLYRPKKGGGELQHFGRTHGLRSELLRHMELERDMRPDAQLIMRPRVQ